jgi:tRNA dimethylallyltransferase
MLGIAEPEEDFSVSRYCEMASPIVDDILARGKTAIIAGGTGLYMDSLIKGNDFAAFPATGHRGRLEKKLAAVGLDAMLAELSAVDPEAAERSQRNPRRVIRALEVFYETGETITSHNLKTQAVPHRYHPLWLGLDFDPRALLYDRIDRRVGIMLEMGLEQEIRDLLTSGIDPRCTAMQAIGYKEFVAALDGQCTMEEAADEVRKASRRYAKRQLTWFRRNPNMHWLTRREGDGSEEIFEQARQIVRNFDN